MLNLASMIDHTLLKSDATEKEIHTLCEQAITYHFHSVCVNPIWVKTASDSVENTDVKVCTVIGFPLGATTSATKVFEAEEAVKNGAEEIDMVVNIGALKDNNIVFVENDIQQVVAATAGHALVKVIIETSLLTDSEKVKACEAAVKAGAHYVKTSTGFSTGGATVEDVALMRHAIDTKMGVKASGGVRNRNIAEALIKAGATRIGASTGIELIKSGNAGRHS